MVLLAIDWASVGVKALQFILSFSILVTLHEFGHYITARWFKCRVDKFYLFFDPWFSLFKKKIGDTEYGIGWVPFGGYVKIAGMVDESMDKEQLKEAPKPYEFRSKKAWQRLIIMCAGVVMNLLLGWVIYSMMLFHWGDTYVPTNQLKYGITRDSLGKTIGLQNGDQILSVDQKSIERFNQIPMRIILDDAKTIQVQRNGAPVSLSIPSTFAGTVIKNKDVQFIAPRILMYPIKNVLDTSAALKAGFKAGDQILAVDGQKIQFFDEFRTYVAAHKNADVNIQILRGKDSANIAMKIPATGLIGIEQNVPDNALAQHTNHFSFMESFPAGYNKAKETLRSYILQLKLLFSGKVKAQESMGGVISMGNLFPSVWNWQNFWGLTAFFSLVLAFMNILPIPALDGGHALFCIIEMITGKKPSDKTLEIAQMVGMVLMLGLMVYALGLDIWRIFK